MKRVAAALLLLGTLSFPAEKKRKSPEIEVVEISVRRNDGRIGIDGKIKNLSDRPYQRVTVIFDFGGAAHQVISTTKTSLDAEMLAAQEEGEFHAQTVDLPRAVEISVRVEDKGEKDLRVDKAGPYPIE